MDPNYEYDAPTYVDFETVRLGLEDDDGVDGWFDQEGSSQEDTFGVSSTSRMFSDNFAPTGEEGKEGGVVVKEEEMISSSTEEEGGHVKREGGGGGSDGDREVVKLGRKRSAAIASLRTPAMKQQRVQRDAAKKASTSIHSFLSNPKTPRSCKSSEHQPVTAKTPEHLRRYLAKKQGQVVKTKEEMEAEEIEKMQEEARKKLRQNRRSFRRLAKSSKPQPVKYSKPMTEAVGFNFRTDKRCQRRSAASRGPQPNLSGSHPSNFPMTLRSGREIQPEIAPKCTKVKPFMFHLDARLPSKEREEGRQPEGYISTAEYLFKFQKETPERFWSSKRKTQQTDHSGSIPHSKAEAMITFPRTPNLHTKTRARPTTAKSSVEQEEEEMAKIREKSFKSQPLNPKVFTEQGMLGVPKMPPRPLTQPLTPKLATEVRSKVKREAEGETADEEERRKVTFKAQPLPKDIFEKVKGVPEKHMRPVTYPESPALELKRRKLHNSCSEEEDEGCHIIVAQPMPNFSHIFKPQLPSKKTEPEPFTFEERYKDKPNRETLVQQILRREQRPQFKANPLPEFGTPNLPEKTSKPITNPVTPKLRTRIRGVEHSSKWRQKLDEMSQKAKENAEFKAKDADILYKPPFAPNKPSQPITEVSNIVLRTEVRSEQRAKFEAERQEKEQQREQENRERQALAEAREAKEVAMFRRSLIHKAQQIRHYAPVVIKPSIQPLTHPESPKFHLPRRGLK